MDEGESKTYSVELIELAIVSHHNFKDNCMSGCGQGSCPTLGQIINYPSSKVWSPYFLYTIILLLNLCVTLVMIGLDLSYTALY